MTPKREDIRLARELAMESSKAILKSELQVLRRYCFGKLYDDTLILKVISERLVKRSFRVHFIQSVYAYILDIAEEEKYALAEGLSEEQFFVKIPFITEGALAVIYHQNFIFDRKRAVVTPEKIRENVLAGNLLERAICKYIEAELKCPDKVLKYLRESLNLTDIGQHIEGRFNTYKQYCNEKLRLPKDFGGPVKMHHRKDCFQQVFLLLKKNVPQPKHQYLRLYLMRISLSSAAMFVNVTELLCELTGYQGAHKKAMLDYAYFVGVLLQIVNDCIDFVPSALNPENVADKRDNCCCDIKNRNITLPLIHFLSLSEKNKKSLTVRLLKSNIESITQDQELEIFEEISPIVMAITINDCKMIAELACKCLFATDISDELVGKTDIATENLFTKVLSKMKEKNEDI